MTPDRRAFSPTALPNLVLWLNAETIAQADSTNVAAWADSSSAGNNASQGTAGRQPTYRTSIFNNRPVVRYDGTADTLANSGFSLGASHSIYLVGSTVGAAANYQRALGKELSMYAGRNNTYPAQYASFYGNGAAWNEGAIPTGHGITAEMGTDVLYVLTSVNNAGNAKAYLNGQLTETRTDAMTAFVSGGYTVGASSALNQFWTKDICEVLIYDAAHSDAERSLVESYLMDRWLTYPRFARSSGNPVIALGSAGQWDQYDIANPHVFRDTPNSRWVMNYSGNRSNSGNDWATGLAYSTNLLTWTKEAANPVLIPTGGDETGIAANGAIVLKGSTYYLYYHAGFPGKIKCATSADLLSWTRQGVVVDVGAGGEWDESATFDPAARLMPDATTIEVFYAGKNASGLRRIGRATATDGLTFTKTGSLLANAGLNGRDDNFGEPDPLGDTGVNYELWCDRALIDGYRAISRFVTSDSGSTWAFKGDFASSGSGWDAVNVFDNCKVISGGMLYLFYAGSALPSSVGNVGMQIGVATMAYP